MTTRPQPSRKISSMPGALARVEMRERGGGQATAAAHWMGSMGP